jgi:uncharacterized protein (TIGR00303 family)
MPLAAGNGWAQARTVLLLAATDTAAVEGISAAGASPRSRRQTAAADAELLLEGPLAERAHALPPLPAGVSPALISHVVLKQLGLLASTLVVDLGCPVAPAIAHLRLPGLESFGPARCLSTGAAMPLARAAALLERGRRWGGQLARSRTAQAQTPSPLLLAECVPGGTTTALAVLMGLGVAASGLVSGSLRQPAHALKAALVHRGLAAAGWSLPSAGAGPDPLALVAAVGDPMQPLAAGLVLAAAAHGLPVVLAGGSQMAAVWALALALASPLERLQLVRGIELATTAWVVGEAGSDLPLLLERIAQRFALDGPLPLQVAGLHFRDCRSQALRDYEQGYVKEGVGAGGLALLWERCGHGPETLAAACDRLCGQWLGA